MCCIVAHVYIASMDYTLLALTIGPGLAIAIYVYWRDKFDPEPLRLLSLSFLLGCISVIPAIALSTLMGKLLLDNPGESLGETFIFAFLVVAFSEELSKYFFLKRFLYPKPDFDEPYDGITYSVMISMGFATLENILYVYMRGNGSYEMALLRMVTAVPAHATFAIVMGYYVGIAKFKRSLGLFYSLAGLLLATAMHGSYDFFLMQNNYPQIAMGAFVSLALSVLYSFKAIRLHQKSSPHNYG